MSMYCATCWPGRYPDTQAHPTDEPDYQALATDALRALADIEEVLWAASPVPTEAAVEVAWKAAMGVVSRPEARALLEPGT